MPQDSIFPTDPRYTGYELRWVEDPDKPQTWRLTIRRYNATRSMWETAHASLWQDTMMDLASTLAEDAQNAFFYDGPTGLPKAAATVRRLARLHRARFTRSTL